MTLHLLLCWLLTTLNLIVLFNLKNLKSKEFKPQNYMPQLPCHLSPSSSGNTTPLLNWSPLSTPAWDPSSSTPLAFHNDDWTALPPCPPHLMLKHSSQAPAVLLHKEVYSIHCLICNIWRPSSKSQSMEGNSNKRNWLLHLCQWMAS